MEREDRIFESVGAHYYYYLIILGFWYETDVTAFAVFRHISSIHFSYHKDYIFNGQAETYNYLNLYIFTKIYTNFIIFYVHVK